jgi:hypothetical protein
VGKPEEERSLGRPGCRRVNNIKTNFRELDRWGGMGWIPLAQNVEQ